MESYNQAPSFQHHSFCPSLWFWLVPTNKQICSSVNLLNPHSLSSNFSPFTTLYALLSWKENFSGNIYSYSFSCPQFFLLLKKKINPHWALVKVNLTFTWRNPTSVLFLLEFSSIIWNGGSFLPSWSILSSLVFLKQHSLDFPCVHWTLFKLISSPLSVHLTSNCWNTSWFHPKF